MNRVTSQDYPDFGQESRASLYNREATYRAYASAIKLPGYEGIIHRRAKDPLPRGMTFQLESSIRKLDMANQGPIRLVPSLHVAS